MPVPTLRLAAVALGLAALRVALPDDLPGGLWYLDGLLAVVAVADWAAALPPGRVVRVTRTLAGVATLGDRIPLTWEIHNRTDRRMRIAVADRLAPSLQSSTRRVTVSVPARGTARASVTLEPARRGRFPLGPVTVRVPGPLGLMARQADLDVPGELRVQPPFTSRREAELRIDRARILEVGLRSAAGRGAGTEFDQLREYTVDDEFRRLDWAATARTNRPIVRTYRAERNQHVMVLLDAGRVMAGRVEGVPRFDHAMDAVMMLTWVATRLGDRTGLVTFDASVRDIVAPGRGRAQLSRVTSAMYDRQPALVESDYRSAFAETLGRFRRRSLLVLLTELAPEAVDEGLLPALPLILDRHLVVVGSVRDPQVQAWAGAEPGDPAGVARRAAAVAALDARSRVAARIRSLGGTVVDAGPGSLAPRLADAYLKVKATGQL